MLRKSELLSLQVPSFTSSYGDKISDTNFWFKQKISGLDIVLHLFNKLLFLKKATLYTSFSLKH